MTSFFRKATLNGQVGNNVVLRCECCLARPTKCRDRHDARKAGRQRTLRTIGQVAIEQIWSLSQEISDGLALVWWTRSQTLIPTSLRALESILLDGGRNRDEDAPDMEPDPIWKEVKRPRT